MNWSSVLGMAAGALVLIFAMLRAERKRMWVVVLLLVVPIVWMTYQWIAFQELWAEALTALVLAGVITGGWWLAYGRKLPPPTSDNIKVWGQEAMPKPRPQDVEALQAEIARLKEEKEKMEAELQRLKQQTKDE